MKESGWVNARVGPSLFCVVASSSRNHNEGGGLILLYHDFPYFFCMAAISSFVFEIFACGVVGNGSRKIATIKKKYLTLSSLYPQNVG
jgi:hypothetical protein